LHEQLRAETELDLTGRNQPDIRESGSQWLGRVPRNWRITTLRHLCTSIQTGPFGSQLHAEDYVDGGTPIINPSNISDGRVVADAKSTVNDETSMRLARHRFLKGDIVIGRRGEMGRCAVISEVEKGWICGTGSIRLTPRPDEVDAIFLAKVLGLPQTIGFLTVQSVGSTMDNLNEQILARVPVALPTLPEQRNIVKLIAHRRFQSDSKAGLVERTISSLTEYRSALISAGVTGQLDICRRDNRMEALG
jgi:type I restriction enzyme, S subunit